MDVEKYKILETDFSGKGVSAQQNPMQKSEDEAKAVFDELVKDVVTPKFNDFVDAFQKVDLTADEEKPVSNPTQTELDKKVNKEFRTGSETEFKCLSDNNFSDEDKKRLNNTLTKDNEEPFTPTGPHQPVTKKYVDDKALETGAADMMQAVYDPRGKKKDIFIHEEKKDNPHGVTAEQIGAAKGEELLAHKRDAENPHSVTARQVGAVSCDTPMRISIDEKGMPWLTYTGVMYNTLESVECTGKQWVDTKFVPNQNTRVVMRFRAKEISETHRVLMGARTDTSANAFAIWLSSDAVNPQYGNVSYNARPIKIDYAREIVYDMNKNVVTVDGNTVTFAEATFSAGCPLALFTINALGVIDERMAVGDFIDCQIYDDDELVRDYIPVKDPYGVACLLDKVFAEFYYSMGSEDFIAGAEL